MTGQMTNLRDSLKFDMVLEVKMSHRNFTLIELSVCILIMAILTGMVLALVGLTAQRNDEAKTIAKMEKFAAALEEFRDANGYYPITLRDRSSVKSEYDSSDFSDKQIVVVLGGDGEMEIRFWNESDGVAFKDLTTYFFYDADAPLDQRRNFWPDFQANGATWNDLENDNDEIDAASILDAWGNPIQYRCPGHHYTDGFDLWSWGPDGENGTVDDLTSWKPRY